MKPGHALAAAALAAALWLILRAGAPAPAPPPAPPDGPTPPRAAKLVIVTQPNCPHCDRLAADWPGGFPIESEWVPSSPEVSRRFGVEGVPLLVLLDGQGEELDRRLGYLAPDEVREWLGCRVCGEAGRLLPDRQDVARLVELAWYDGLYRGAVAGLLLGAFAGAIVARAGGTKS